MNGDLHRLRREMLGMGMHVCAELGDSEELYAYEQARYWKFLRLAREQMEGWSTVLIYPKPANGRLYHGGGNSAPRTALTAGELAAPNKEVTAA